MKKTKFGDIPNARFWTFHKGSPLKLRLAPGQKIELLDCGPTEEGYHSEWGCFTFDGQYVQHESVSDGQDCDGRLRTDSESCCRVDLLNTNGEHPCCPGMMVSPWERPQVSVYDQFAQLMNY
jgi:hypothetical protein